MKLLNTPSFISIAHRTSEKERIFWEATKLETYSLNSKLHIRLSLRLCGATLFIIERRKTSFECLHDDEAQTESVCLSGIILTKLSRLPSSCSSWPLCQMYNIWNKNILWLSSLTSVSVSIFRGKKCWSDVASFRDISFFALNEIHAVCLLILTFVV